ncbi:MAG: DegT/DnrJ/EryC1/StrS family aminotransferase [Deltaproteobacteria bacterium]|nr:DegT/DnrJ/EryC1/StrS family aminotransferase [Deltaproteobacteria bacterium]
MAIPLQRPYLGREELDAVAKVFESRWLGMGAATKEFEDKLRDFLGAPHVIAVNTGTSALHIALDACGIAPGDEVIVPSLTFAASVQVITCCGAQPVFCDVEIDTFNMDPADVERRISPRTRAVMPVHFGGLACDMDRLLHIAKTHNLLVIEDAAHAFGSSYKGRTIGTLGHVTCFSFDPIKNITCGEGGAVVTADDDIAARVIHKRILGIDQDTWSRYRHERSWFYEVVTPGYRYHMSNINAAIGLEQLKRLEAFRARKTAIVKQYDQAFRDLRAVALLRHDLEETFPFFYVLRVLDGRRDELMDYLKQKGVASGVHYIPNHLQPLYADFRVPLPVTEQIYGEMTTLPLFYEMADDDPALVIEAVRSFFGR